MLKYISEEDYVRLTQKSVPSNNEIDFNQAIIEASNYINSKTFNRINPNDVSEQIKYVTTLIIDLIIDRNNKLEKGNLRSENVEGWSVSYATQNEIKEDYENRMYDILKQYLSFEIGVDGLPLLYCGVM